MRSPHLPTGFIAPLPDAVNVFSAGNGYAIALTYGPETDWVKNVLAAGGCELRTRSQTIPLPRRAMSAGLRQVTGSDAGDRPS